MSGYIVQLGTTLDEIYFTKFIARNLSGLEKLEKIISQKVRKSGEIQLYQHLAKIGDKFGLE